MLVWLDRRRVPGSYGRTRLIYFCPSHFTLREGGGGGKTNLAVLFKPEVMKRVVKTSERAMMDKQNLFLQTIKLF